jgi:hypothetical protein
MTTFGVSEQGFVAKTAADIVADLEADQLATVDPLLDMGAESFVGQNNAIFADKLADAWATLAVCYDSISRADAEGNQLDNVGALTGSLRLRPKPSFVLCTVAFGQAGTYSAGSLVANVSGLPSTQFANALDISVPANDGAGHATIFPFTVTGVLFVSEVDGPVLAPSGTLNTISAPVTGWTSITNPLDATPGNLLEEDDDYRVRQEEELAASGSGTVASITADLLEVANVQTAKVIENTSSTPDPVTGTPGRSMQAIIYDPEGADSDQIAQSLLNGKPAGIGYYGSNSSGTATDAKGGTHVVPFTRPAQLLVYLAFTVTFTPDLTGPEQTAAIAAVKAAAVAYGVANLSPGVGVKALRLASAADGVAGIDDVTSLALDFVPSPTNTANLPVGALQVAQLDTSRVLVNGM